MERDPRHCYSHFVPFTTDEEEYDEILEYLKGADLRRGDLIVGLDNGYRNNDVSIYDGRNIVELYTEIDDYGSLPPEFRAIENNIPIRYWKNKNDTVVGRGIDHNSIVWVSTHLLLPYINNIQTKKDSKGKVVIFLTFAYQNNEYVIIFDYATSYDEKDADEYTITPSTLNQFIEKFQSMIRNNEVINLFFESEYYGQNTSDNTLYW